MEDILLLLPGIQVSHTLPSIPSLVILRLSIGRLLFIISAYLLPVRVRSALFGGLEDRVLEALGNYRDIDPDCFLLT